MTEGEKDPRIEAVAKLLFTGPLYEYRPDQWESEFYDHWNARQNSLAAAADIVAREERR